MPLTDISLRTLQAVVDRIIPPDDTPGAWEAGFPTYLDRLLEREPRFLPLYEAGIPALNSETQAQFHADFAELDAVTQDALLNQIERGEVQTEWPIEPKRFFSMLVHHTSESFYADPANGGNRDAVSWHMIGYIPQQNTEVAR